MRIDRRDALKLSLTGALGGALTIGNEPILANETTLEARVKPFFETTALQRKSSDRV
jgi:hypothetical protein